VAPAERGKRQKGARLWEQQGTEPLQRSLVRELVLGTGRQSDRCSCAAKRLSGSELLFMDFIAQWSYAILPTKRWKSLKKRILEQFFSLFY